MDQGAQWSQIIVLLTPTLSCNKEQAQDTQSNLLVARNAPYNAPMIDPFWTWKPLILLRKPRNAFRLELTWDHCSILHSVTIQLQNKAGRWVMVGASHSRKTLLFRFSICWITVKPGSFLTRCVFLYFDNDNLQPTYTHYTTLRLPHPHHVKLGKVWPAGPTFIRLVHSHWSRASLVMLVPAVLWHKEPARAST